MVGNLIIYYSANGIENIIIINIGTLWDNYGYLMTNILATRLNTDNPNRYFTLK